MWLQLGDPLDISKPINLIIFGPFCVREALGNMLTSIITNCHFGKRPGAGDMTILGSHVGPNNIHS